MVLELGAEMESEDKIRRSIRELRERYPPNSNKVWDPESFAAGMIVALEAVLGIGSSL